jgi:monofunctional chorismate mutase
MSDLNILREKIDNIDERIVKLLCERFNAVKEVAEYKKEHGLEILQKSREAEVLNKIAGNIGELEYKKYIQDIYEAILKTSKDLQGELYENK